MNKKKALITGLPILIIGVLVFIILLFFVLRGDVLGKVKLFLPDFSSANEDLDVINVNSENFLSFEIRTSEDVLKSLNYGNEKLKKCFCGSDCENYAKWIVKYSDANGIPDALIVASLIMQESFCDKNSHTESSYGLMQINLVHCGKYGLLPDLDECQEELLTNPEKNIEVGVRILKDSYNSYNKGKQFSGACSKEYQNVFYSGWEAAVRGYNGWGCNPKYPQQDIYVEEVVNRFNILHEVLK